MQAFCLIHVKTELLPRGRILVCQTCRDEAGGDHHAGRYYPKTCPTCLTAFVGHTFNQIYCQTSCQRRKRRPARLEYSKDGYTVERPPGVPSYYYVYVETLLPNMQMTCTALPVGAITGAYDGRKKRAELESDARELFGLSAMQTPVLRKADRNERDFVRTRCRQMERDERVRAYYTNFPYAGHEAASQKALAHELR